ncbi:MAG: hypothetical protein H8E35_04460 [Ardenticatenia bacterium]|nr:hypothetical protein [Ardenticatenia bacterium]
MRWVEIVEVKAGVAVALAVAAVADRAGWAAKRLPARAVTAFAPIVGAGSPTRWECLVTRISAQSAAQR